MAAAVLQSITMIFGRARLPGTPCMIVAQVDKMQHVPPSDSVSAWCAANGLGMQCAGRSGVLTGSDICVVAHTLWPLRQAILADSLVVELCVTVKACTYVSIRGCLFACISVSSFISS